jgi:hypothetical protein
MKDRDLQGCEQLGVKFADDPGEMLSAAPNSNTIRSEKPRN